MKLVLLAALSACTHSSFSTTEQRSSSTCAATAGDSFGSDECLTDSDCAAGTACSCAPNSREWAGVSRNLCIAANCRSDADCAGETCSPSNVGFYGVDYFACHTPEDTCGTNADCPSNLPHCTFTPEVAHWSCTTGGGAG